VLLGQVVAANLSSLVYDGTFEEYRDLRIVFSGWGFAWLPSFRWKLDQEARNFAYDLPWVRRPPSEYIAEHIRLSAHSFAQFPDSHALEVVLDLIPGSTALMFGSHYPLHDSATGSQLDLLKPELRRRVAHDNATEVMRWPRPAMK